MLESIIQIIISILVFSVFVKCMMFVGTIEKESIKYTMLISTAVCLSYYAIDKYLVSQFSRGASILVGVLLMDLVFFKRKRG